MSAKVFLLTFYLTTACGFAHAQSVVEARRTTTDGANAPVAAADATADEKPLPAGAIARLGTTRFRPTSNAQGVSFLPDGQTLVTTTSDGRLEYWDAQSGRFVREVQISDRYIHKAAHTPDGRLVAIRGSYSDQVQKKIVLWVALVEAETGKERMQLSFSGQHGEHLALSADGSTMATERGNLGIINTAAKAEVLIRPFAGQRARSLGLSADGKKLAVGGENKVYVWSWAAGTDPQVIALGGNRRRRTSVMSVEFSPDGKMLAAGGDRNDGIILLDVERGQEIRRLNVEGVRFWYPRNLAFSRDGRLLAAPLERGAGGGGAAIWNIATGKLHKRLTSAHESVHHLAFSPDGRRLAGVSNWHPQLCVWDLETGERRGGDAPGHVEPPAVIRFLPSDERLVSAGDDGSIRVWNLANPREVQVLNHERDESDRGRWIRAMDVSSDGKRIASSSLDDTVRVWETDSGRELYRLPGHGQLGGRRAVRFTPDGQRLVSWGDDMRVYQWDLRTGKAVEDYRAQPTGLRLPSEVDGSDPRDGREGLFHLDVGDLSPDASRLLVLGPDTRVFDIATGKQIATFNRDIGYQAPAISPDNAYTLALSTYRGDTTYSVELRLLSDGKLATALDGAEGGSAAAAFSYDSRQAAIAIGHYDSRVLLLKVPNLDQIAQIDGLRGQVRAVAFSPSGRRLAVSNADTSIVVYDLDKVRGRQ